MRLAALDVGSTKICCLVADATRGEEPKVIGIGQQASHGVRRGAVVDMEATQGAIRKAVHAAEQMAGETIEQVVVNLSGGYPIFSNLGLTLTLFHEIVLLIEIFIRVGHEPVPRLSQAVVERSRWVITDHFAC